MPNVSQHQWRSKLCQCAKQLERIGGTVVWCRQFFKLFLENVPLKPIPISRIRFSDIDRNMGGIQIFSYNFTSLANNRSENKWQKKLTETPTKLTFGTKSV